MFKKIIFFILLVFSLNASAQCAMCKAVIEGGNETIAEGVNNGITYLMVFPYILVGLLFYFIYRHKKKAKN
ncbi:hypothetical protein [Tenacibaculum singaporense]|jgi:hypothetical protein|uniref:Uncharacterized protein n=1 Tax=Tenacibaculum singaporense TaxID=2358479 RepID=A0A3Q8RLY4_9FLAO|nr:hypothetical protein [Tenacibaculum singaporense]AZJ34689.1 hypothetical protein D6T69_03760 [Tenacibaculum singaporense]RSC95190.1 hypothetical protein EI424_05965 [Tenacibaculum singaporense]GFD78347.1 hypothetical protein KUL118_12090 [Tenacibaculum sp. KUL118]